MKKKLLAIVLAGMFALGAAACGGGDAGTGTDDGAVTGSEAPLS